MSRPSNPTCRTCRHRAPGEPLRCGHPTEPVDERILQWQERTGWVAFWCGRHAARAEKA